MSTPIEPPVPPTPPTEPAPPTEPPPPTGSTPPPPPFGMQPSPDMPNTAAPAWTAAAPAFTPPPGSSKRNIGLIIGLIAGGVVVLGIIVVVVILVLTLVRAPGPGPITDPNPIESTTPTSEPAIGSTVAVSPDDCVECYDYGTFGDAILPASDFAAAGLTDQRTVWAPGDETRFDVEFPDMSSDWVSKGVTPDECFVIWSATPISEPLGSTSDATDPIAYVGIYADDADTSQLAQTIRVFPTQADAVAHMQAVEDLVAGCPSYAYPDGFTVEVLSAGDDIVVPATVAVTGWLEQSENGDLYYAIDLQRGNLVERTVMRTDGTISASAYHDLVEKVAANLGELDPTID